MPDPSSHTQQAGRWYRLTLLLALAASAVGAAAWMHPEVDGADLWWHMAAGRWVVAHGMVPLQDVFTHTALGQPWADHEWLWGVLAFRAYEVHPDLVAWLNLAVAVAIFVLVAVRSFEISGSWWAACLVTWMAAAASHWYIDVRPHLFTLLFSALLLATFRFRLAPWLWPPLMALWANLHGGFIFGVGLVGLHVLMKSVREARGGGGFPVREWMFVVATLLAVGLNPWGLSMYLEPFEHLRGDTPFSALLEWVPLEWSADPSTYAGRFLWLGVIAMLGFARLRDPYAIALVVLTAVMTAQARRFVPLFAVVSAPVAAAGLVSVFAALGGRLRLPDRERVPEWVGVFAAGALVVVGCAQWSSVRFTPEPLKRWTLLDGVPTGAVAYLAGMERPPQHLLNTYEWGGYISYFAPEVKTFIDGRAATLYSDELVADYHTLVEGGPGTRELLRKYQVDAVLIENPSPLAKILISEVPRWRRIGLDPRNQLFFAPGRSDLKPPIEVIGDTADFHLIRARTERMRGDLEKAADEVAEVIRRDPLQIFAYGEGMMVAAHRSDASAVQSLIERAQEIYPRRHDLIMSFAERAWRTMGEPERQRAALDAMRLGGPFVTPESLDSIEALRRSIEAKPAEAPDSR